MISQERRYSDGSGRELTLVSSRGISKDGDHWELKLELYAPGLLRRKRIDGRRLQKSGDWSTAAIVFLQAQEELEMLRAAGVELELLELL